MLVRQKQESQRDIIAQKGQAHIQRLPGGTTASPVPIKTENNAIAGAQQFLDMSWRGCRTQRGHGKTDALLSQPNHIHVALDNQYATLLPDALPIFPKTI